MTHQDREDWGVRATKVHVLAFIHPGRYQRQIEDYLGLGIASVL